jgi:low temperature requirement protein LtrA
MLLAVWWTWINVVWWTDWIGTESGVMRLELIAAMAAFMLMAIAIPEAFDDRGLLFAVGYVAGRVPFHVYAFFVMPREHYPRLAAVTIWIAAASALWIAGALVDDDTRVAVWCGALLVEVIAPLIRYRTSRFGEFHLSDEEVSTHHLVERFLLFIILVLGESIVLTGATAAGEEMSAVRVAAIVVAVLVTAALWALYFGRDEQRAQRLLAEAAGPILFLLGSAASMLRVLRTIPRYRIAAAGAIAAVALLGATLPGLATWSLALAILASVVLVELRGS